MCGERGERDLARNGAKPWNNSFTKGRVDLRSRRGRAEHRNLDKQIRLHGELGCMVALNTTHAAVLYLHMLLLSGFEMLLFFDVLL